MKIRNLELDALCILKLFIKKLHLHTVKIHLAMLLINTSEREYGQIWRKPGIPSTYVCRFFRLHNWAPPFRVWSGEQNKTQIRRGDNKSWKEELPGTTARMQQHLHIISWSTPIYKLATAGPRNFIAASWQWATAPRRLKSSAAALYISCAPKKAEYWKKASLLRYAQKTQPTCHIYDW